MSGDGKRVSKGHCSLRGMRDVLLSWNGILGIGGWRMERRRDYDGT